MIPVELMLFNSFVFLGFFIVTLVIYQVVNSKARKLILLLASYSFYAVWDWRFLPLLMFSSVLDFTTGKLLWKEQQEKKRKFLLALSLTGNLLPLFFFKYYNFLVDNLNLFTAGRGNSNTFNHLDIILPLGISFYTFQTLSYSIDLYQKKIQPARSIIDFSLFVSFFPQLIAGPIEKSNRLLPQLSQLSSLRKSNLKYGLLTLLYGLFLKSIIGDSCAIWADKVFAETIITTPIEKLLGTFLFSVQIYMDFSGYSLMAIGLAKCFGIRLSTNFAQPYLASNITDFWRRWHITLSLWLKEYIYIPLGGNKNGKPKQLVNLFITMLIGGIWHGANWTFVIWGAVHGAALIVHKIIKKQVFSLPKFINIALTFLFVSMTWVLFRANSMQQAQEIFLGIGTVFSCNLDTTMWQPFIWCGGTMFLLDWLNRRYRTHLFIRKWPKPIQYAIITATITVLFVYLLPQRPQPFIYFQF